MDNRTLEQKAADTILQKAAKVKIGGKEYEAAPPSIATLILVSEAVSRLPQRKLDDELVVSECLNIAKDCKPLGDIAAVLILGARLFNKKVSTQQTARKGWFRRFFSRQHNSRMPQRTQGEVLSQEILETFSPKQLYDLIAMLLQRMDLGDFFALTTFLTEVNLLRQTKVEKETTAFGR